MDNFEKIEGYLTNTLSAPEREAFEKELFSNSELKQEMEIQEAIIDQLGAARTAQLKTMLNNVPVGGSPLSWSSGTIIKGVGLAILGSAIIYTAVNFWPGQGGQNAAPIQDTEEIMITDLKDSEISDQITEESESRPTTDQDKGDSEMTEEPTKKITPSTQEKDDTRKEMPDIKVIVPQIDMAEAEEELGVDMGSNEPMADPILRSTEISAPEMEIFTRENHPDFNFHYRVLQDNLYLYGPFEKDLYEILEIISAEEKTLILYYKERYYVLDVNQSKITPLDHIKDRKLRQKLSDLRNKQ